MKSVTLLALGALAMSATTADAQSQFLGDGASGLGINVGVVNSKLATGFGGTVSLTSNGMFDLGVGVNRYEVDSEEAGFSSSSSDLQAIGVAPQINLHLFRQTKSIPVSFMATGSYEWVTYRGDLVDDLNMDITGASYEFGGAIYSKFGISPMVDLIPTFGIRHVENTTESKSVLGGAASREDVGTTYSLTPSLGLKMGPVNILNVNPTFEFSDGRDTTFGLSVGLALPFTG